MSYDANSFMMAQTIIDNNNEASLISLYLYNTSLLSDALTFVKSTGKYAVVLPSVNDFNTLAIGSVTEVTPFGSITFKSSKSVMGWKESDGYIQPCIFGTTIPSDTTYKSDLSSYFINDYYQLRNGDTVSGTPTFVTAFQVRENYYINKNNVTTGNINKIPRELIDFDVSLLGVDHSDPLFTLKCLLILLTLRKTDTNLKPDYNTVMIVLMVLSIIPFGGLALFGLVTISHVWKNGLHSLFKRQFRMRTIVSYTIWAVAMAMALTTLIYSAVYVPRTGNLLNTVRRATTMYPSAYELYSSASSSALAVTIFGPIFIVASVGVLVGLRLVRPDIPE